MLVQVPLFAVMLVAGICGTWHSWSTPEMESETMRLVWAVISAGFALLACPVVVVQLGHRSDVVLLC